MKADERRRTALMVMLQAWRVHGHNSFPVNPKGRNWGPLHDAEKQGWVRFWSERCRLTEQGLSQIADYLPGRLSA